jgi:hypothetical protein
VLRNQLNHSGATYKSSVNSAKVKNRGGLMISLMPMEVEIMMSRPDEGWGKKYFPPIPQTWV